MGETFSGVDFELGLEVVEELRALVPEGATLAQLALRWILELRRRLDDHPRRQDARAGARERGGRRPAAAPSRDDAGDRRALPAADRASSPPTLVRSERHRCATGNSVRPVSRSRPSATAPGGSAGRCGSAPTTTSRCARCATRSSSASTSSTPRTATATATARSSSARSCASSAETVYVATKIPPKNRRWPAPAGVRAEDAFPADWIVKCTEESLAAARRRDDRRAAVPRLVGRVGRPRRLARRRRAAEARRQDPLLRRLDQRPPACERGQAGRVGPRRHRPGDLQHLRPEPRGRAVPGGRGGRRGRDRARPVRRGRR